MLQITQELESIMQRFQLSPWEQQSTPGDAVDYLRQIFTKRYHGQRLAIRGAGGYVYHLLRHFGDLWTVVGLYDQKPPESGVLEVDGRQYPVYGLDQLGKQPFDLVVNGVLIHRKAVMDQLFETGYTSQYIDLDLLLQGTPFHGRGRFVLSDADDPYTDGYTLWNRLAGQAFPGGPVFWQMIRWLLTHRDLYSAKRLLRELSWTNEPDAQRSAQLLEALEGLEEQIRHGIAARSQGDIVVFLHDMLAYSGLPGMEWLSQQIPKGWYYESIYSSADFTGDSMRGLLGGYLPIDDLDRPNWEQPFLSMLAQHGVQPTWIGLPKANLLPQQLWNRMTRLHGQMRPCTQVIWECYDSLLTNPQPQFIWLHFMLESHAPFHCPFTNTQLGRHHLGAHRHRSVGT